MTNDRGLLLKAGLPFILVVGSVVAAKLLIDSKPPVEFTEPPKTLPLVRVLVLEPTDVELMVASQGVVAPRTEIDLAAEVPGRVVRIGDGFENGGYFEKGAMLFEIDRADYELAVARARAGLRQAEVRVALQAAEAEDARREWREVGTGGAPSPLAAREPQLIEAKAAADAAQAELERAERDLARSRVRAPFTGRVRRRSVDVGQFVNRGEPAARLYAVDYAEIRLPLPLDELAHLQIPVDFRAAAAGPPVRLSAEVAGRRHTWPARIVRSEGVIDARTRMITMVARVEDPYGRGADGSRQPLPVGLFVDATISGRKVSGVFALPRAAMRGRTQVLVVDHENVLRFRDVEVIRAERDRVIVGAGVSRGERVCVSPLNAAVEGMLVRVAESAAEPAADPVGDPADEPGFGPDREPSKRRDEAEL